MGWYIQVPEKKDKAKQLVELHDANIVSQEQAKLAIEDLSKAVIVVCDNGPFEAAGFACDDKEFEAFTQPSDRRPKQFLIMDRDLVKKLSGYDGK